jgi:hypothetical protein
MGIVPGSHQTTELSENSEIEATTLAAMELNVEMIE